MNKNRRKELYAVVNKLLALKNANDGVEMDLESAKNDLSMILYDEESYMDNIPENMQGGYRYQTAEDACDNIECAIDALDDEDVDSAINYIYSATV